MQLPPVALRENGGLDASPEAPTFSPATPPETNQHEVGVALMNPAVASTTSEESADNDALLQGLSALLYLEHKTNDGALRRDNVEDLRGALQRSLLSALGGDLATLFRPQLALRLAQAGFPADEAERIEVVMEAVRKISTWWPREKRRVQSPADLAAIAAPLIGRTQQEELHVAVVDGRNGLVTLYKVYVGTATGTSVRIAEILRPVLDAGGVGFAVVHNHPSGDPEPSEEDVRLTAEVAAAARLLDLEFLDHLVIGGDRWVSIRSQRPTIWARVEVSG